MRGKIRHIVLALGFVISAVSLIPAQQTKRGVAVRVKNQQTGKIEDVKLYEGSYALIIGESDYTNGWKDLPGVKSDVKAVASALRSQGFAVTETINPTRTQLTSAIDEFINNYGYEANNRLLIYYAGHGHTQKSSDGRQLGYIIPSDAPLPETNERQFRQLALSMNEIENYARRIEAKHALFIFDSCFSGTLLTKRRSNVPPVITLKTTQAVRQFITAGSDEQEVPDESVFRREFIEGIGGEGDLNGDGYITGSELADFLQTKVTNYTRGSQTPQYGKIFDALLDKGDFVFISKNTPTVIAANNTPTSGKINSADIEREYWESIKNSSEIEDFRDYKDKYPNGNYAALADLKIKQLSRVNNPSGSSNPNSGSNSGNSANLNTPSKLKVSIEDAFGAYERGDIQSAIKITDSILENDENNGVAIGLNGFLKGELSGNYSESIETLERAVRLSPSNPFLLLRLALLYGQTGNYKKAVGLGEQASAYLTNPKTSLDYFTRSVVKSASGKVEESLPDLNESIRLNPENVPALLHRAFVHTQKKRFDLAKADIDKAVSVSGEMYLTHIYRGMLMAKQKLGEAAFTEFDKAVQLNPNYPMAYVYRADAHADQKRKQAAIADLTKAINLVPNLVIAYQARAKIYLSMGKIDKAMEDNERANQIANQ